MNINFRVYEVRAENFCPYMQSMVIICNALTTCTTPRQRHRLL